MNYLKNPPVNVNGTENIKSVEKKNIIIIKMLILTGIALRLMFSAATSWAGVVLILPVLIQWLTFLFLAG